MAFALLVAATPAPSLGGSLSAFIESDPLRASVPVPTADSVALFTPNAPGDPYEGARSLVDLAFEADPATGSNAVTEILRRSGIPVVSPDGPIIALPDDIVLVDAAIYDGSVADLARSLRQGDGWSLDVFTAGLKGSPDPEQQDGFGALEDFVEPQHVAAAMGAIGRDASDPPEVAFAGAVIRALSGRRGEVLFQGSEAGQLIDPLQFVIFLSMWTSNADHNKAATANGPEAPVIRLAATDPCAPLVEALKEGGAPATAGKDVVKEVVKRNLQNAVPSGQKAIRNGFDAWDVGTSALSLIILLLGMELELTTDKTETHFKHRAGDRSKHVKLKAVATFDSALAQHRLGCYKLAGLEVRRNGPQAGFRVFWDLNQPAGSYSQYGIFGTNPFPLFQQGRLLAPINADNTKIGRVGSRGGAGQVTGNDGTSTLELHPPVEKKPGQGRVMYGNVRVKAALTHDDMPRLFKITDPSSLIREAQNATVPIRWAIKKSIDIALSYLKRSQLPERQLTVRVGYHGADVYVVKGSGTAFLFFYKAPFQVDIYTCDGLRVTGNQAGQITGGRWRGRATFGTDRIIDPTVINGLLQQAANVFRAPISQLPQIPESVRWENPNVDQVVDALEQPDLIHLVAPHLDGWMTITNPPPEVTLEGELVPQHVNGPVGEIELFIGSSSLDTLGTMFGGWWSAKFMIVGVPQDPRCPGSGPDDYYYDRI